MTLKERLLPPRLNNEGITVPSLGFAGLAVRAGLAGARHLTYNDALNEVARRIDALEAEAVKVYARIAPDGPIRVINSWDEDQMVKDTHSALLINIQELKRGVSRAEIIKYLKKWDMGDCQDGLDLADRIESEGIVND